MHFLNGISTMAMAFVVLLQGLPAELSNKKSVLTVDRQVELPGVVLEPGTYVIRLLQADEKRSLVQVLNRAEYQVLATVVAVPDHRVRPDASEFSYHAVADGPRPLRTWYYSYDAVGLEFVYPRPRATEMAKASESRVMASSEPGGAIIAVTPNGKEIVIDEPLQTARQKPQ